MSFLLMYSLSTMYIIWWLGDTLYFYLSTPSQHLNQCGLIISKAQRDYVEVSLMEYIKLKKNGKMYISMNSSYEIRHFKDEPSEFI